jgi:alkaline phosphatase D
VHDSTASGQEDTFDIGDGYSMDYKAWNFTQEDNFCRVDVDHDNAAIVVRVFDSKGERVKKGSWFGIGGDEIESTLQLAPW